MAKLSKKPEVLLFSKISTFSFVVLDYLSSENESIKQI